MLQSENKSISTIARSWVMLISVLLFTLSLLAACGGSEKKASGDGQLYTCGMHPQVIQDEPGICPICQMNLTPMVPSASATGAHAGHSDGSTPSTEDSQKRSILYWQAPMDPSYISDKPGKSPMGMDLIPVYEGEQGRSGATVSIDPVTVQNMGVRYAEVKRQPFNRVIRTVGHVDYNEETLYTVNTKFDGWIEKLYVDRTGDEVRMGQPLFSVYSPELVSTQEEYLLAFRNQKKLSKSRFTEVSSGAERLLKAARQRLELWDISEKDIKALEASDEVLKTLNIYSPASGVVVHKNAIEGGYTKAGMDLFRIADLSKVWVYAHIFEYELPWIKVGQSAEIELPYIPGKRFVGTVDYVYPYLDSKTRDVKVRLVFHNSDLELKPQMYANIQIRSAGAADELTIPTEAIIRSGKRNVVFIELTAGKFRPQDVVIGPEGEGGMIKIISGLKEGQRIVTSAQFLLDSESRLQEAIQKMLEAKKSESGKTERKMQNIDTQDSPAHDTQSPA